jgi:hypothetical protein
MECIIMRPPARTPFGMSGRVRIDRVFARGAPGFRSDEVIVRQIWFPVPVMWRVWPR